MRLVRILLTLLAIAAPSAALAQSTLLQGGAAAPGRVPMYVGSGTSQIVVQDSGPAGGGGTGLGLSELLQVNRTATGTGQLNAHACFYDNPITSGTGYHFLCFDANAQGGGLIAYGNGGGASTLPFAFNVNGVAYNFPFTVGGIVGPNTSAVGNAACWNNLVGTLLKDCGPFVLTTGANVWSGANNFTSTFQISSVTQTFPASGLLVGTTDAQVLTNKSIAASEINSGTLAAALMPALTGDVTSVSGSVATTIAANAVTNAKLATAAQNTVKGAAVSTAVTDLTMPSCSSGGSALQWTLNSGFSCATLSSQTAGWGLTGTTTFSISTAQPPYGFEAPINAGFTASVGSSALTINLTGANGAAPSATNPISIPFRSTTLATGTPVWATVTAPLSIVVPSSATLGTSNSVPFRVWIFVTYNSGVPQLGVAVCSSATAIYPCTAWEATRKTTIAIDGSATSSGVLYATAGVNNDAVRIIGYAEYATGLTAAGTWASTPTTLQLVGTGGRRPGDVVQTVYFTTTTTTALSSVKVATALAASITPQSAVNLVVAEADGLIAGGTGGGGVGMAQLFRTSGATAIGNVSGFGSATAVSAYTVGVHCKALDNPQSASAVQYGLYLNYGTGGTTFTFLSTANSIGTNTGILTLQEIMGALPEPANDNENPGVYAMTG